MCWEMDYHWFAEQQRAQEEREKQKEKQAQRADALDKLLREATKQAEGIEERSPSQETVPAK